MTAGEERAPRGVGRGGLWLPAFDGVRGFCTMNVALVHVILAIGWVPRHEVTGSLRYSAFFLIEFLFVIGGFVAMLPMLATGGFEGVRSYAVRRVGRLLPLYYLTLAAAVVLGPTLRPVSGANSPHDFWAVLTHFGFLQHEVYPYRAGFGIQGIVWVLSVVAIFYLLFPLIADRWARHPFIAVGVAAAVAVAWREALADTPEWFLQFPLFFVDFAIGMTAAWVYVRWMRAGRTLTSREALPWFIIALAAMVPLLYLSGRPVFRQEGTPWGEHWFLALAVPSVFAVILLLAPLLPRWARLPFDNRVARFLGQISYGVFLFHFLVIWTVLRFVDISRNGSPTSVLKLAVLVVPLTVLCAWLGTKFVEGPIRRRAQRKAVVLEAGPKAAPRPEPVPAA